MDYSGTPKSACILYHLLAVNYLSSLLLLYNLHKYYYINAMSSVNQNLYHFQNNFTCITLFDPYKNTSED